MHCPTEQNWEIMISKGDEFSQYFKITEEVYRGFVDIFKDNNFLHTDNAFAQAHGFREKVMHGNILNGFLSFFVGECLPFKNVIIHTQEITYNNPVYMNDILKFHAVVAGVHESVNTIELKFYFENANKQKVAKGKIQIGILQ